METAGLPGRRIDLRIGRCVLCLLFRLFFRLYGRWRVLGLEGVPRKGPLLFAANHASVIDPPLAWAAIYGHRRMWGVARHESWDNRALGWVLDCMGVLPVKRGGAGRGMFRLALAALERGETVGLFPEGTRTHDGRLNPGQTGVAILSQKLAVPIVPVALVGTFEMLPRGAKKLKRVPLVVAFGKPLVFAKRAPRAEIVAAVMRAIAALMTEHGYPTDPPGADRAAVGEPTGPEQ
jgi:1-acyl-sn-glycerol-3-phosphate acyltransferase